MYFPVTNAIGAGRPDICLSTKNSNTEELEKPSESSPITIHQVCSAVFLAATLLSVGERIGGATGALPCCTMMTVLFASLAPRKLIASIRPAAEVLGTCFLYLFFATAGAPGAAISIRASFIPLSIFLTCLYSIHGLILWALNKVWGKYLSFDPRLLLVASSAAIGGPATSVALAQANNWNSLVVPSLLVGKFS